MDFGGSEFSKKNLREKADWSRVDSDERQNDLPNVGKLRGVVWEPDAGDD